MDATHTEQVEPNAIENLPETWKEVVKKLIVRSEHKVNSGNGWEFVRKQLLPKVFSAASKADQLNGVWDGRYKQDMLSYLAEVKERLADYNGGALPGDELEDVKSYCEYITKYPLLDGLLGVDLVTFGMFVEEKNRLGMPTAV